jgi:ribose transport system ATP-binding protein
MSGADALILRGIGKAYGSHTVLADLDLDLQSGEVLALVGENGAGKSTASAVIAGVTGPTTGQMVWRGRTYAPRSPRDARLAGISLIHQELRLVPHLTIAENVFIGRLPMRAGRVDRRTMNRLAAEALHHLGLDAAPTTRMGELTIAAQQQVEIAKALTSHARVLVLDEPTAALGAEEATRLFEQIGHLKSQGVSFIYISHRLDEIARVADRVAVLRDGRLVASHDTPNVAPALLVEQMVGRPLDRLFPTLAPPGSQSRLEVDRLTSATGAFGDVSFSVKAGEVFGIAGIVGAGRSELVRAIAGADRVASGTIKVDGLPVKLAHPRDALDRGIGLVPEDRKAEGVILMHTVADNLTVGNAAAVAPSGWLLPSVVDRFAGAAIARWGIRARADQPVGQLSGGNQQKVVIARCLARQPQVLILDEPTRGIDVGARAAIYEIIADLARRGVAVVVVSSDLDEVLGLSHRVMVLSRGVNRGVLNRDRASRRDVMTLATM